MRKDLNPDGPNDTDNNRNYKKVGDMEAKTKEISDKPMEHITGGGMTGTDGPTESSRSYPKGSKLDTAKHTRTMNPMNDGASQYGIAGVGKGED
jgi:hypothetical protein